MSNDGTTSALPNEPIGVTIGPAQYDQWRANFGSRLLALATIFHRYQNQIPSYFSRRVI
jgi:hypothetical protein